MTCTAISDSVSMVAGMTPELRPGLFVFATVPDGGNAAALLAVAVATFREAEGLSLIVPQAAAAPGVAAMRMITLNVYSSVEGVGLTAAVAGVLAQHGIACNMVAAYHHDHIFVPSAHADEALALLLALQAGAGG